MFKPARNYKIEAKHLLKYHSGSTSLDNGATLVDANLIDVEPGDGPWFIQTRHDFSIIEIADANDLAMYLQSEDEKL